MAIICFPNERNKRTKTTINPSTDAAKNAAVAMSTSLTCKGDSAISTSVVSVASDDQFPVGSTAKTSLVVTLNTENSDEKNKDSKIDSASCDQSGLVLGSKKETDSEVKDSAGDMDLFDNLESNIFIRNGEECGDGERASPVDLMENFLSEADRGVGDKEEEDDVVMGDEDNLLMRSEKKNMTISSNEKDVIMENEEKKLTADKHLVSTDDLKTEFAKVIDSDVKEKEANVQKATEQAAEVNIDSAVAELALKETKAADEKNDNTKIEINEKVEDVNRNEIYGSVDELKSGEESKEVSDENLNPDLTTEAVNQSSTIPVDTPNTTDENVSSNPSINLQSDSETTQTTPSDQLVTSDVAAMVVSSNGVSITAEGTADSVLPLPAEMVPAEKVSTPATQPNKVDLLEEANPARKLEVFVYFKNLKYFLFKDGHKSFIWFSHSKPKLHFRIEFLFLLFILLLLLLF